MQIASFSSFAHTLNFEISIFVCGGLVEIFSPNIPSTIVYNMYCFAFRRKKRNEKQNNVMIEHFFVVVAWTSFLLCRLRTTWLLFKHVSKWRMPMLSSHSIAESMLSNISLFCISNYFSCTCMPKFKRLKWKVILYAIQIIPMLQYKPSPPNHYCCFFLYSVRILSSLCFVFLYWAEQVGANEMESKQKKAAENRFLYKYVSVRAMDIYMYSTM